MAQETVVAGVATTMTGRETFRRIPTVWKAAVVVGVLGWFFSLGGSTTTTINGVTDCDGTDIGPLVVAGIVAALGVVGFQRSGREHPARRLPNGVRWGGMAVLAAIVAVHVLRVVIDPAGRAC
jgi:hypothetical protein